jgi:heme a synthase
MSKHRDTKALLCPLKPAMPPPMTTAPLTRPAGLQFLSYWLAFMCALVFAMVVVGGATRLTESGLSIPYWQPVKGALPPLSAADWTREFELYQASPQYQQINAGMSLAAFKGIFWWEWAHRQLGRFIGFAFALPFAWALWRHRTVLTKYRTRLWLLLGLGGLQGFIGWWMVASGLVQEPSVSHYRLATHLGNALLIFALLFWTWLDVRDDRFGAPKRTPTLKAGALVLMILLILQIILGAFVAGKDAGHASATWPLMDGHMVPRGLWSLTPAWRNLLENDVMLHWLHRSSAYLLAGHALVMGWRMRAINFGDAPIIGWALIITLSLQFLLGILTVLHGVPVLLGTLHQANAVLLLATVTAFTRYQYYKASA